MELLSWLSQNAFQAFSGVTEGDYVLLKADGINGETISYCQRWKNIQRRNGISD